MKKYIWCARQLGKSKTEGSTTPPLARKEPQRFADLFASLWGIFTQLLALYYYNVQYINKYRPPQYQGYSPHAQMPLYNIEYVAVW